jgi:hypothetical protein
LSDLGRSYLSYLDEPFLTARVLAKRLATSPHTIKEIVARDLGMRRLTRSWVPHELTLANKAKRVEDARMLLQVLRSGSEKHFACTMTGDESWFSYNYESPKMFGHGREQVIPRVSQTIGSKKQ